jgi:hypothetical protein
VLALGFGLQDQVSQPLVAAINGLRRARGLPPVRTSPLSPAPPSRM